MEYIKYLIEHKDSRLYVKEITKGTTTLTSDHYDCIRTDTIEEAKTYKDSIVHKDRFKVVEHGFYNINGVTAVAM